MFKTNLNHNGRLGAEYTLAEPLRPISIDTALLQKVRLRNTGRVSWPSRGAYPIHLCYHWLDAQGQMVDFEGVRTGIEIDLEPGHEIIKEMYIEPPEEPGAYQLVIDMVEEGVGWFSLQGVLPLTIPVTVEPGAVNRPQVCIIGPLCLINDAVGNHMRNQLRFFQSHGYQALIMVEHIDFRHPREERVDMVAVPYADLANGQPSQYTRRALRFFQNADIYVFHFPLPYSLFDAITLVERGVVIMDYHGVTPPTLWDGQGRDHFIATTQRQLNLVRYADYAIAHSSFTRDELVHTGLIAPERVYVQNLVVSLDRFHPGMRPHDLLARYGLEQDQPVLLYVGRIATNKRIEDLVQALAYIRKHEPHAILVLVGDNTSEAYAPVAERAQALAESLHITKAVIFAGRIPDAELAAHYHLADVFVIASVHEGFCIPVMEAMACGVPVIGAHATALPETIGAAGLTFHPENPSDLAEKVLTILAERPLLRQATDR